MGSRNVREKSTKKNKNGNELKKYPIKITGISWQAMSNFTKYLLQHLPTKLALTVPIYYMRL